MVSAFSVQGPVGGYGVFNAGEDRHPGEFRSFGCFGCPDTITAASHSFGRFGTEAGRVNGFKIRGQFSLGGKRFCAKFSGPVAAGAFDLKPGEFVFSNPVNVAVEFPATDGGRFGARAAGVVDGTHVVERFTVTGSGHYVAAGGTSDEPSEQRGMSERTALGAIEPDGKRRERFGIEDRIVRLRVHVVSDLQFPEVHPVAEHVSEPVPGHAEVSGDFDGGRSGENVPGGLPDLFGLIVNDEFSGVGVTVIPAGRLATLPDPSRYSVFPGVFESFPAFLEFCLIDRGPNVPLEASCGGGTVNVLSCRVGHAPGFFDLIPKIQHEPKVAARPGHVGHYDAGESAGLDSVDGFPKDGPVGIVAFPVEFGWKNVNLVAVSFGPGFDFFGLVFGGAQVFSAPYGTDPSVPGEHGRGVYGVSVSRSTTASRNPVQGFLAFGVCFTPKREGASAPSLTRGAA